MEVVAVGAGVIDQIVMKLTIAAKQARVITKEAEDQAHQIDLQVAAPVTGGQHGIMQVGHFLGGPLVDGGLLLGDHAFITGQKKQGVNVRGQFARGKQRGSPWFWQS